MSVGTTTLTAPTLTCDAVTVLSVGLHWTSSPDAAGYNVYRSLNGGGYSLLTSLGGLLGLVTSIPPLLNTYHYRVQALRKGSPPSAYSNVASTMTIGGLCVPAYTVTVTYPHRFSFVGGIARYFGGTFGTSTLTATSTMRAEAAVGACGP